MQVMYVLVLQVMCVLVYVVVLSSWNSVFGLRPSTGSGFCFELEKMALFFCFTVLSLEGFENRL